MGVRERGRGHHLANDSNPSCSLFLWRRQLQAEGVIMEGEWVTTVTQQGMADVTCEGGLTDDGDVDKDRDDVVVGACIYLRFACCNYLALHFHMLLM
ncbi:hypothetical protein SESBI_45737 [Sesbania bispinosa]|nr:hypothetical protein SESBI_45737 [Sesbania bispinosa]